MVDIIYSSLENNSINKSRTDNLFFDLDSNKYPYRCFDLMTYKNLKDVVNDYSGYENLPIIFINDFFVGGYNDFKALEDSNHVPNLLCKGTLFVINRISIKVLNV